MTCTYLAKRLRELSSTKTGSYPHEFLCRTNCSACGDYQPCLFVLLSFFPVNKCVSSIASEVLYHNLSSSSQQLHFSIIFNSIDVIWAIGINIVYRQEGCSYNYRLIHGLFHIALAINTRPWYRPRGTISVEGWWQGQYEKDHVLIYLSHILLKCYCPSQKGNLVKYYCSGGK